MNDFWQRLKQRKLVQWALAYVAFWFALLQGIDIVASRFDWPDSIERYFILVLAIGFCVVLVLAWYHGERGAQRIGGTELVIIALLLAIGGGLIWRFGPQAARSHPQLAGASAPAVAPAQLIAATPVAQAIPAKSIAVLPFENLSNDKNNEYFVAGMQDLILTKLADIGDLKVIARTSTEKYTSHPTDLKTIGRQLGVATILEGSVQKQGNEVLINVQLINAQTAAHLWAKAYTRTLTNVFGVEGEVATQIATSLNAKLSPAKAAQLAAAPSANQAAMDLFLRAEYQAKKSDTHYQTDVSGWQAAIPLYRQALAKDSGFALAYARLSNVESNLAYFGGENVAALNQQARTDAEAAQKLAPHAVATLLALGYCDYYGKGDFTLALETFKAALAVRPNDSAALAAIGYVARKQNHYDAALASLQQAFALDPRNSPLAYEIGMTYMQVSRYPAAGIWFQRALALDPNNLNAKSANPFAILLSDGDVARALAAAGGDEPAMQSTRVSLLTYQRKYRDALALLDAIPDTPDNFALVTGQPKALQQADLYRMMGEPAKARLLYQKALVALRQQLAKSEQTQNNLYLAYVWQAVADAELGLGQTKAALTAIASAQAANTKLNAPHPLVFAYVMELNASRYAQARRPDLAVPLLARALTLPAIGANYSPVLLWLDPAWDPIRHSPAFQALLQKYAKHKPAVTYPIPPASAASAATAASLATSATAH